eukprot:TRINITY_DN3024_c0_g1_i1.p1 TRINITY_DN3024_c0_g1~~TRINITY_DN3024_c0_g1_i1.p1  ORF type:complete len:432 (-),score=110.57 TRINITY_DN3024_c0_g1_i1:127-1422(-)
MDKIVELIRENSSSENNLNALRVQLKKEESNLSRYSGHLDDALSSLDPAAHSLGYTFLLATKLSSGKLDAGRFVAQAQALLLQASSQQVKMVSSKFIQISSKFADICIEAKQPIKAVKPLHSAVVKVRASSETLTPIHETFVKVCLLSKCYHAALPILQDEVFDVSPETSGVGAKDVLLYFYFGAMIYIGLKKFKQAFGFLKTVIVMPSSAVSSIMIEAYKKYLLVSLILTGKVGPTPRYVSAPMQRATKNIVGYTEFVNVFAKHNTDELHKVATTHAELFQKDKNFGLVKQAIQVQYKQNIQRFTQTYVTFSLGDLTKGVGFNSTKDVEKRLLEMVENREIFATINQKDGMVAFGDDDEGFDTNEIASQLDQRVQKIISYGQKIRSIDENIASSIPYLQKLTMDKPGRGFITGTEMDDDGGFAAPFRGFV